MNTTDILTQATELLEKSYDIYVGYDDKFSDDQIIPVLRHTWEGQPMDRLLEWESDCTWDMFKEELERITANLEEQYDDMGLDFHTIWDSEHEDLLRDHFHERISGSFMYDLARGCGQQLFRDVIRHVDNSFTTYDTNDTVDARTVLTELGWPTTDKNVELLQDAINNAPTHYIGIAVIWASRVTDLMEGGDTITVTNPHVVVGNEQTGAYSLTDEPLELVHTVKRENLELDSTALGYSVGDCYGLIVSAFQAETTVS